MPFNRMVERYVILINIPLENFGETEKKGCQQETEFLLSLSSLLKSVNEKSKPRYTNHKSHGNHMRSNMAAVLCTGLI